MAVVLMLVGGLTLGMAGAKLALRLEPRLPVHPTAAYLLAALLVCGSMTGGVLLGWVLGGGSLS